MVTVDGFGVPVEVAGPEKGSVVVVLGAAHQAPAAYDPVCQRLHTASLRTVVIGPDPRLTGKSVVGILDSLDVRWALLVGDRLGGELAWELAATARPYLSRIDADRIYITLGIGETFAAIEALITAIACNDIPLDDELMAEVADVRDGARPAEILLVADAMTGQDAVNVAQSFNEKLALTGIVLTRVDGDARGGAALSMKAVTGTPIRLLGTGEKLEALEAFHPDRIASRILGMGDVVSLVEKATELVEQDEAERLMKRMEEGKFDLDDFASQLRQLRKMGGLTGVMGMLPGVKKAQAQMAAANVDDKMVVHQEAIIGSMTVTERKKPDLIKASRKRRIAAGSGTTVQDVNKLLKQYLLKQKVIWLKKSHLSTLCLVKGITELCLTNRSKTHTIGIET